MDLIGLPDIQPDKAQAQDSGEPSESDSLHDAILTLQPSAAFKGSFLAYGRELDRVELGRRLEVDLHHRIPSLFREGLAGHRWTGGLDGLWVVTRLEPGVHGWRGGPVRVAEHSLCGAPARDRVGDLVLLAAERGVASLPTSLRTLPCAGLVGIVWLRTPSPSVRERACTE